MFKAMQKSQNLIYANVQVYYGKDIELEQASEIDARHSNYSSSKQNKIRCNLQLYEKEEPEAFRLSQLGKIDLFCIVYV